MPLGEGVSDDKPNSQFKTQPAAERRHIIMPSVEPAPLVLSSPDSPLDPQSHEPRDDPATKSGCVRLNRIHHAIDPRSQNLTGFTDQLRQ